MPFETPPKPTRGRPPVPVLIALTLTAVALHGCVLDGVPGDAAEALSASAVSPLPSLMPVAPAVRVRALSMPSNEMVSGANREAVPPVAAVLLKRAARPSTAEPFVAPVSLQVTVAEPRPEPPAPATPEQAVSSEPPASPPRASDGEASAPSSHAPAISPLAAPSEPVVLRQPEQAVPVYRTQIPPATTLEYDIRRGSISGTGELTWRPDGGSYEARLQASVIGYTLLTQISQGGFDKAGLAPLRFTDQRARKAARAANFQRDVGKITFSGPRDEFALPTGSQDRLSWMIQLPAVLAAEPKRAVAGGEVALYVAGVRADVDLWTLRCIGVETVETAAGPVRTVKFMRTPRNAKDTLAEVWLDPTRHYLPMRARLTYGRDEEDAFELVLRQLKPMH